jgi:hypothetical protein
MNTPVYRSEVDVPLEIPFLNNITPYKINLVFTNQSRESLKSSTLTP